MCVLTATNTSGRNTNCGMLEHIGGGMSIWGGGDTDSDPTQAFHALRHIGRTVDVAD